LTHVETKVAELVALLVRFGADGGRSLEFDGRRFCPLLQMSEADRTKYLLEYGSACVVCFLVCFRFELT
jgi:hypothetical protein